MFDLKFKVCHWSLSVESLYSFYMACQLSYKVPQIVTELVIVFSLLSYLSYKL